MLLCKLDMCFIEWVSVSAASNIAQWKLWDKVVLKAFIATILENKRWILTRVLALGLNTVSSYRRKMNGRKSLKRHSIISQGLVSYRQNDSWKRNNFCRGIPWTNAWWNVINKLDMKVNLSNFSLSTSWSRVYRKALQE